MWSSHWSGLGGKSSRVIWWLKIPAQIQLFRHQMVAAKTRHCVNVPWGTFIGLLGCQHTMTLEMTRRCSDSRNWEIPLIPKSCVRLEVFRVRALSIGLCSRCARRVFWKCPWPFWAQESNVSPPCLCKYNSIHSENSKKTTTKKMVPGLTSAKVHFPCACIHPRVLSLHLRTVQWNFFYFLMLFFLFESLYSDILSSNLNITWPSSGKLRKKTEQKHSDSLCAWQRMTACRCT